jgi:ornithine carbamoyltransferase
VHCDLDKEGEILMAVNLKGRSFLTLMDFTPAEIRYMLDLSHDLKAKKRAGIVNYLLKYMIKKACPKLIC